MLKILEFNEKLMYDISHIARLFFDEVRWVKEVDGSNYELIIAASGDEASVSLSLNGEGIHFLIGNDSKNSIKKMIYKSLNIVKESKSQYGILVGVRPVKVVHQLMDQAYEIERIKEILSEDYMIHEDKIELLLEVALKEREYIVSDLDAISLYIGIPFCPSICTYCSFPSNDIHKKGKLVEPYIERLCEEIDYTFELIEKNFRVVDNIYIGGGTPTAITAVQLERIFEHLSSKIDLRDLKEFTVEAGRPDSITKDHLDAMKTYGVNRVCLNPQTLNNEVLTQIGRKHTAEDIKEMMNVIDAYNFDSVNMDLIIGLPHDTLESVKKTIREVIDMGPNNITVHTLAIKKASYMKNNGDSTILLDSQTIEKMLDHASTELRAHDYAPYYLYRQKNILGNFENIGYALPGKESIYNIRIIEERHNILALGVGGVSKQVFNKELGFNRIPNFRSVEDYITRFDEMLSKKEKFFNLTSIK